MLSEAVVPVIAIARDFVKNFPDEDTPATQSVISASEADPNDPNKAYQLFRMTQIFFNKYEYAELEDDDRTMYNLRQALLHP